MTIVNVVLHFHSSMQASFLHTLFNGVLHWNGQFLCNEPIRCSVATPKSWSLWLNDGSNEARQSPFILFQRKDRHNPQQKSTYVSFLATQMDHTKRPDSRNVGFELLMTVICNRIHFLWNPQSFFHFCCLKILCDKVFGSCSLCLYSVWKNFWIKNLVQEPKLLVLLVPFWLKSEPRSVAS